MPYDGTGLDETTKVLLEARRLVEEGWCQGAYEDAAGNVCLLRALALGSLGSDVAGRGRDSAYKRVVARIPDDVKLLFRQPVVAWNDAHGRTQAEVLALLDRAIAGGDA